MNGEGDGLLRPLFLHERTQNGFHAVNASRIISAFQTHLKMRIQYSSLVRFQHFIPRQLNQSMCFFMCNLHTDLIHSPTVPVHPLVSREHYATSNESFLHEWKV